MFNICVNFFFLIYRRYKNRFCQIDLTCYFIADGIELELFYFDNLNVFFLTLFADYVVALISINTDPLISSDKSTKSLRPYGKLSTFQNVTRKHNPYIRFLFAGPSLGLSKCFAEFSFCRKYFS